MENKSNALVQNLGFDKLPYSVMVSQNFVILQGKEIKNHFKSSNTETYSSLKFEF